MLETREGFLNEVREKLGIGPNFKSYIAILPPLLLTMWTFHPLKPQPIDVGKRKLASEWFLCEPWQSWNTEYAYKKGTDGTSYHKYTDCVFYHFFQNRNCPKNGGCGRQRGSPLIPQIMEPGAGGSIPLPQAGAGQLRGHRAPAHGIWYLPRDTQIWVGMWHKSGLVGTVTGTRHGCEELGISTALAGLVRDCWPQGT